MQRNRRPDLRDIRVRNVKAPEVLGRGVGAADLEALRAVVLGRASDVVEETGGEEDGETRGSQPGGAGAAGEGVGVEVGAEAVVEERGREALSDEVVGACAYGGWGNDVGRGDGGGMGGGMDGAGGEGGWRAHCQHGCA